jgi:hypothetical protein
MVEAIVTGIVGGLLLLMLGWLKSDIGKIGERIDTLTDRTADLLQITARTEGKLEEHLRQHH